MSEAMKPLLPCPFCGSDAREDAHADECYFILHRQLKAGPDADLSLHLEVLAAWNRRNPPLAAINAELAEALTAMEREKSDYMTLNNLGDPAKEHTNKMARAALAKCQPKPQEAKP